MMAAPIVLTFAYCSSSRGGGFVAVTSKSNAKAELEEVKSEGLYDFVKIIGGLLLAMATLYAALYFSI